MKIFQVIGDFCHWDATKFFPTLDSTQGHFPASDLFVEAPDHVFEGWGYVDGEFIKPGYLEGWVYDEETGTWYPDESSIPEHIPSVDEFTQGLMEGLLNG